MAGEGTHHRAEHELEERDRLGVADRGARRRRLRDATELHHVVEHVVELLHAHREGIRQP